jgi:peptidoglycan-associated lipoprotein
MMTRYSKIALVALLTAVPLVVGCAKTPSTTTADGSAPAPGGSMDGTRVAGSGGVGGSGRGGSQQGMAVRPDPKEFVVMKDLRDIRFDFDRYEIRPEDAEVLDANADLMKSNPGWLVLVEGHADQRGTTDYNMALSDRRAKATMNYLISRGVRANRITMIGYGEERPACKESSELCWSQNRRAHFMVKAQ